MLKNCLEKIGKQISSGDREDLSKSFGEFVGKGMSEYDASVSALSDYHKAIFDSANDVRRQLGIKEAAYTPVKLPTSHQPVKDIPAVKMSGKVDNLPPS